MSSLPCIPGHGSPRRLWGSVQCQAAGLGPWPTSRSSGGCVVSFILLCSCTSKSSLPFPFSYFPCPNTGARPSPAFSFMVVKPGDIAPWLSQSFQCSSRIYPLPTRRSHVEGHTARLQEGVPKCPGSGTGLSGVGSGA